MPEVHFDGRIARAVVDPAVDFLASLAGDGADWSRSPFTGDSPAHVSVWEKSVSG